MYSVYIKFMLKFIIFKFVTLLDIELKNKIYLKAGSD